MKMKRTDFENLLKTLDGVQIFYNHTTSKDRATAPFIVYLDRDSNNQFADNRVWEEVINYEIHVFSLRRDEDLEKGLKDLLNDNEIPYQLFDVDFDEDDLVWEVIYTVSL